MKAAEKNLWRIGAVGYTVIRYYRVETGEGFRAFNLLYKKPKEARKNN